MRLTDMQVADCVECCVYDRVKVSDPFLALFLGEEQRHLVEGVEDGRCVDEVCALLSHRVRVLHVVQQTSVHTLRYRESSTHVECDLVIMIFGGGGWVNTATIPASTSLISAWRRDSSARRDSRKIR